MYDTVTVPAEEDTGGGEEFRNTVGRPGGAQRVTGGHTLPALHADSLQPVQRQATLSLRAR